MSHACESCGMPIEAGRYCQYCVTEEGVLQDFPTRFERMARRHGGPRDQAERDTIARMATMPAWKDHPEVRKRLET